MPSRERDTRGAEQVLHATIREDTEQLRVTVLTTLQCNFACDYCFQGDHGDHNKHADEDVARRQRAAGAVDRAAARRAEAEAADADVLRRRAAAEHPGGVRPGGAGVRRRARSAASTLRSASSPTGCCCTEELVDRLLPFGLGYVKVTLDGDRDTHNRMRPLRGGQGTFDRIIENVRKVAGKVRDCGRRQLRRRLGRQLSRRCSTSSRSRISPTSSRRWPSSRSSREQQARRTSFPLTVVTDKPLSGTCMTAAGSGGSSICDTCQFVDEQLSYLRDETKKRGFPTVDGVHMGPCEIHKRHALHDRPGRRDSTRAPASRASRRSSTGHIDDRQGELADVGGGAVRAPGGVAQVRRLRVHSGVRGRLFGRLAHRAWRHEHADMSQAELSNRHSFRWRMKRPARLRRRHIMAKIKVIKSGKGAAKPRTTARG